MSRLEVAFYVVTIVGGLGTLVGVPSGCVWLLRRLRRANAADTKDAIDASLTAAMVDVHRVLSNLQAQVADTTTRVGRVEYSLSPNGGSSLADRINQTAGHVSGLVGRFEDHLAQSIDDRARLASLERDMRAR